MLFENDFNYHKLNMKEWFIQRGYPEAVIEKEMKNVKNLKGLRKEHHLLLSIIHWLIN